MRGLQRPALMMNRMGHVLAGCLLLAGCVEGVGDGDELGATSDELSVDRWDPQSDRLLGAHLAAWDAAFAYGAALVREDARGFVTPPPAGGYLALAGLQRDGGPGLDFRVHSTGAVDGDGRPLYRIQVSAAGLGDFKEYCGSASALAYALQGSFDVTAGYRPRSNLSFACPAGAAAKAIRWNLALGSVHPTGAVAPNPDGRRQAAATAMARADFCGNAVPHTLEGTPIQFDDVSGYAGAYVSDHGTLPEDPAAFRFEAAWTADGYEQTGIHGRALCISKWRWQVLAPSECGNVVPDPRVSNTFRFCEDYPGVPTGDLSALAELGAVVFSYSTDRDVGLWAWYDPATARYVTTEQGAFNQTCPPQLSTCNKAASFRGGIRKDGDLDDDGAVDASVVPLVLYRNMFGVPARYRTTTASLAWTSGWAYPRTVGYLFRGSPSTTVPGVALYEYTAGGQYRLFRAGEAIPSGWTATRRDGSGQRIADGYAIR